MKRASLWIGLLVLACGGGMPPDKAQSTADPGSPEPTSEAESDPAERGATATSGASQSAATPEDMQKVLQLVIDDEALQPFLRLGEPGRFPFKISGVELTGGLSLSKGPEPVEIIDTPQSGDAVLVFTEIEITANQAWVSYRYDIEGVRGSASLERTEYGWALTNSRVVER